MKAKAKAPKTKLSKVVDLRLYIAGQTPKSLAAISNLKRICAEHVGSRFRVEVIDLSKNPGLARDHQILAIPTLVRSLPVPIRKIIGICQTRSRWSLAWILDPAKVRRSLVRVR
jgi:circadian clock protein KaiB